MSANSVNSLPRPELSEQTAVIVVDVQNDFCHNDGALGRRGTPMDRIQATVPRIAAFVDAARQAGLPIIFIRTEHGEWTNSASWVLRRQDIDVQTLPICQEGSWGADFYKIAPKPGDRVVIKHRYSAFIGTDLDLVLRTRQIRTLLMTGITTNVCVESTSRDGFMMDYRIVLVDDCCGAPSPEEHHATLTNIRNHFGTVVESADLIATWARQRTLQEAAPA